MKLFPVVALATACSLAAPVLAQKPDAKGAAKPAAAAPQNAGATGAFATLDALQKDFKEKKFAALDLYAKTHADAKDSADALAEAVELAQELQQHDHVLRLTEQYLKANPTGQAAGAMQLARGEALGNKGDVAGAQKIFEKMQNDAGDDVNAFVEATTKLADLLVTNGKKDAGIKVLNDAGEARQEVRGLKQHLAGIAKNYEMIGSDPIAMGQNDIAGKAIDLAEYKGKVLLIDFWATWCGPCMGELPNVIAAYDKFHGKGFEILGISLDEDKAAFEKCIADRKMSWRHHFDGGGWKNEIAQAYGVQSIPATYLVGKDGKIVAMNLRGPALEKELTKLLAGDSKPAAAPAAAPKK